MPIILDTFNVLHTVGILPPDLAGLDVPGLAELMLRSRYRSERVTFVCDGLPPTSPADLPPPGPLSPLAVSRAVDPLPDQFFVRYAGRASTADDLIHDIVNASTAPRRLLVVSSDHAVQKHARRRRCAVLSSEEFLQHLADDAHLADRSTAAPKPQRPLPSMMSREQVARWMDVFDVDEAALATSIEQEEAHANTEPASQAGPELSAVPRPPTEAPLPITSPQPAPLPADLISQAEALWQNQQPLPAPQHPTPGLTNEEPDRATPPQPPQPRTPSHPDDPSSAESDGADDLASLDMNAILPRDGRTQPLSKRKRTERQRPSPPNPK